MAAEERLHDASARLFRAGLESMDFGTGQPDTLTGHVTEPSTLLSWFIVDIAGSPAFRAGFLGGQLHRLAASPILPALAPASGLLDCCWPTLGASMPSRLTSS